MKKRLTIIFTLLILSLTSCSYKKETDDNEIVYEVDGVTFYEGNNYFLEMAQKCSIYNAKENSIDLANLTGTSDFKHYAFIKDDKVCIGEFASDYDTHTKSVYSSNLTVKEYCDRQLEGFDVIYIGPYFTCYKEKSKYTIFSYPLSSNKKRLYNGKDDNYYLPEGSELTYFGDLEIPYGVSICTKEQATKLMETYLDAIFINYDTMNHKDKKEVPIENKKKEQKIMLCFKLDEDSENIL